MTQIQDRIRFWFRRNDREFIEQVERDREEAGIAMPVSAVEELSPMERLHYELNQFPVGMFFDAVESSKQPNRLSLHQVPASPAKVHGTTPSALRHW